MLFWLSTAISAGMEPAPKFAMTVTLGVGVEVAAVVGVGVGLLEVGELLPQEIRQALIPAN